MGHGFKFANCKRLQEAKFRWFMMVLGGKNGRITVYGYGFTDSLLW